MRRRKLRARFFVMLFALVAIAVIVALLVSLRSAEVKEGSMVFEAAIHPVVIRDEKVISEVSYGKIDFFVKEGEQVTADTKIAEIYKYGYNDNTLTTFTNLRNEIKDYQVEVIKKGVIDEEIIAIDAEINQKTEQILRIVAGKDNSDLLTVENELKGKLEERRIMLESGTQADSKLNAMYLEEQETLSKIEVWKREIRASESGVVSLYFDGYEQTLNKQNQKEISPSSVNDAIKGTNAQGSSNGAEKPLYRIVNGTQWYVALYPEKNSDWVFVAEEAYEIYFDGYDDKPYIAFPLARNDDERGNYIYIFAINDDIGPFLSIRTTKATIKKTITGVKVPNRCIHLVDGKPGIYVGSRDNKRFVEVTILGVDGRETFIRGAKDDEPVEAGMYAFPK